MVEVGVSASSSLAAAAGAEIADRGGNAVDATVAAALVSLTTDVAFTSPGASGFVAVWPVDGEPTILDAYAEYPGRGIADREARRQRARPASFAGVTTYVGYPSIATPGALAGLARASELHGHLPWREVFGPALRWAEEGFPISASAQIYFDDVGDEIVGWHPESVRVLRHESGRRVRAGDVLRPPGLADSLRGLAERGVGHLYGGELGARIGDYVEAGGGLLTSRDLAAYEVRPRTPLRIRVGEWDVALNPPPAVGGVTLAATLLSLEERPLRSWDAAAALRFAQTLRSVLEYRRDRMHDGWDPSTAARELLESLGSPAPGGSAGSPSTVHTSAVDADGLACAVTLSDGYGSGAMVPGTGMWLNNSLGEVELLPLEAALPPPGTRLISNMAPTLARRSDGTVLAIGSPGADRITSSLAQVLCHLAHGGASLQEAIDAPRVHVELSEGRTTLVHEASLLGTWPEDWATREVEDENLYFGSVQAVQWSAAAGLTGAADSRRDAVYEVGGG